MLSCKSYIQNAAAKATFDIFSLVAIRDNLLAEFTHVRSSLLIIHFDYCNNSAYAGHPKCALRTLQLALNMAARLVYKAIMLSRNAL